MVELIRIQPSRSRKKLDPDLTVMKETRILPFEMHPNPQPCSQGYRGARYTREQGQSLSRREVDVMQTSA